MRSIPFCAAAVMAMIAACVPSKTQVQSDAQARIVALTVDDLPFVKANGSGDALAANRKLLQAFARHHVPVTGFVVQKGVEELDPGSGTAILSSWVEGGFDLGNHSYAHSDFNDLSIGQFEGQVIGGEAAIGPLMREAGRKLKFFRFPFNHTGDTKDKHDALAAFLAQRGYQLAPCTIETEDWMFNSSYGLMLARHDDASARRLRADYLTFTGAQIDYFDRLNEQVWGRAIPQIMLIHDNQLNADVAEELLALFERRLYRWVSLPEAESDPAYQFPDTFVTNFGPMWGYRWARERDVKVDGRLEPDPPQWIAEYPKADPTPTRRARSY
jgi:peptidoglycan/xylan/chitin deacetylase (PgdA/CDA1 family)